MPPNKNASEPQNDREWLIKLESRLDRLSDVMERLDQTLNHIENKQLAEFNERMIAVEKWQSKADGMWKAIIAIGAVSLIALLKSILK